MNFQIRNDLYSQRVVFKPEGEISFADFKKELDEWLLRLDIRNPIEYLVSFNAETMPNCHATFHFPKDTLSVEVLNKVRWGT